MATLKCVCAQSCLTLCDLMDCNPPAALTVGFSRQESWNGLPFPPSGDHPDLGIEPMSPAVPGLPDLLLLGHLGSINSFKKYMPNYRRCDFVP